MELDHGRFWDLVVDALERIGETADTGWTPRAAADAVEAGTTTTPEI
jgi:purine nucleosidase